MTLSTEVEEEPKLVEDTRPNTIYGTLKYLYFVFFQG